MCDLNRSEDPQLLYRSLVNLGKVQRFDMTLMFMTGTDKKGSFHRSLSHTRIDLLKCFATETRFSTTTHLPFFL